MKKQRKFNVGDKVRLTAYKKDKIVGEVIGVFYTVYPDNCIVYKYDVLVDGAPCRLHKYPFGTSRPLTMEDRLFNNLQVPRVVEWELKKVEE